MCTLLTLNICLMCYLQYLSLDMNVIGDTGLIALAKVVESGALASLKELHLHRTAIGDAGISALADALGKGALASLREIWVGSKHMRHPQLVAACQPRGIQIK